MRNCFLFPDLIKKDDLRCYQINFSYDGCKTILDPSVQSLPEPRTAPKSTKSQAFPFKTIDDVCRPVKAVLLHIFPLHFFASPFELLGFFFSVFCILFFGLPPLALLLPPSFLPGLLTRFCLNLRCSKEFLPALILKSLLDKVSLYKIFHVRECRTQLTLPASTKAINNKIVKRSLQHFIINTLSTLCHQKVTKIVKKPGTFYINSLLTDVEMTLRKVHPYVEVDTY